MRHIGGDLNKFKQVVPREVLVQTSVCDWLVSNFDITSDQAKQMVQVRVKNKVLLVQAPVSVRQALYQRKQDLFSYLKKNTGFLFERLI